MTVSPRMIASEAMMSPLAANCTNRSSVSKIQGASSGEMLTSKRVGERPAPYDAKVIGLTG